MTLRLLAAAVEPRGAVTHVFGALDEWHLLRAVGRRPIVFTVALPGVAVDRTLARKVAMFAAETEPLAEALIKGGVPSGQLWEAYKVLFEINSTLQRLIVLPPGAPRAAYDALRNAIERLNHDKDFAAEAIRAIEFAPDYPIAPDMSQKVRAMMQATPQMRTFINDYMRNVPKN